MLEFAKKTEQDILKVQDMTQAFIQMQNETQLRAEQENRRFIQKMEEHFNQQMQQVLKSIESANQAREEQKQETRPEAKIGASSSRAAQENNPVNINVNAKRPGFLGESNQAFFQQQV